MKKQFPSDVAFPCPFRKVTSNEIISKLKNLGEPKASQSIDISIKIYKKNYDIFATFITENFNNLTEKSVFPDSLKRCMYTQMNKYFDPIHQFGFRKGYSSQQC